MKANILRIQTYIVVGLWEENMISCDGSRIQGVDLLCVYGAGIDVRYNASKEVKLI
jgi:hypothetical protein